jgi:hypothetical protein
MKKYIAVIILSILFLPVFPQAVIKTRTAQGYVNITRDPSSRSIIETTLKTRTVQGYVNITRDILKPPNIEFVPNTFRLVDADGNGVINANEKANISFDLINTGQGPGINLEAKISEKKGVPGLKLIPTKALGTLEPGNIITVEMPVEGTMNTTNSLANFSINVNESNGLGTGTQIIEVQVKAFVAPMVKIVSHKFSIPMIDKKKPFDVQVLVQNVGQGTAENVTLSLTRPDNVALFNGNSIIIYDKLAPGEQKLVEYSMIANNNYMSGELKLSFQLKEQFGKYSDPVSVFTVPVNQQEASNTGKLVITAKTDESKKIEVGSLLSAVDEGIPINNPKKSNRIALIIGNEDYSRNLDPEANVDYALNDAAVFKDYAIKTLCIQEDNIFFLPNATAGDMHREIDKVSKLLEAMGPSSELIFYYAGHGFPEESTKIPYLIPVDVTAATLTAAIKLSDVYTKFGNSGASRITVFLDACFSGGGRNKGIETARGVRMAPNSEQTTVTGNMIIFSACSGEQSALALEKEKHGLFTFYLLKKLKETSGNITYEELYNYIKQTVHVESIKVNSKVQVPDLMLSPLVQDKWKTWKVK